MEKWNISCPKCKQFHKQKRGFRILKNRKKQIYCCMNCRHIFAPPNSKIGILTNEMKQKIIELYHTWKPFRNKYDPMKKTTYSTREIGRMMGITSKTVSNVININKNE